MVQFGLGQKDSPEVLNFERAWPKKLEKPIVNLFFDPSSIIITTENGLKCSSFCVSFSTNTTVKRTGKTVTPIDIEGPKFTMCNSLDNGYLDGKGKKQYLTFKLEDTEIERPTEFEFLCDGFRPAYPRKKEEAVYRPEYGHLFKIIGEGGEEGTIPLYEGTCWPSFVC